MEPILLGSIAAGLVIALAAAGLAWRSSDPGFMLALRRKLVALEHDLEEMDLRHKQVLEQAREYFDAGERKRRRAAQERRRDDEREQREAAQGNGGDEWLNPTLPEGDQRRLLAEHFRARR